MAHTPQNSRHAPRLQVNQPGPSLASRAGTGNPPFHRRPLALALAALWVLLPLIGLSGLWQAQATGSGLAWAQTTAAFTALCLLLVVRRGVDQLIHPLTELRNWAKRVRGDNLSARLPSFGEGEFGKLSIDINKFTDTLQKLSENLDAEVERQTERIAQKNSSLQVLYDVAASLNASRDLDDLLTRFLHTMRDIVNAKAGTVRLLTNKDQMALVASIGLSDEVIEEERLVPVQRCLCGSAVTGGDVLFQDGLRPCNKFVGRPMLNESGLEMIAVPLQYRGKNLGVYNLFVERAELQRREEFKALFTSIGRHLGMAIEKARLDEESKRLSIMQERNTIAHELHDSLAQTLASLRFQVSMLDETIDEQNRENLHQEIQQIKGGLDEAYTELRELLAHFRAPMNAKGLLPALEDLISSFRKQTGMHVFLQKEWESTRLPANKEMQVLRIVQEALANVRKHSRAHTVRVLLRCDQEGSYHVLIEDDGVGMDKPAFSGHPGENLGLSIMQERARYLDGELRIESEPGEGTRVQLTFNHPGRSGDKEPQHFALI